LVLQAGCQEQAKVAQEATPGTPLVPKKARTAATEPKKGATEPDEALAEPDKSAPKITFESLVYDFGKVGPSRKLLGEFKFTNTGDAPLKITKVEKCCGAVTRLAKTDYAPGESGLLKVEYRSSSSAITMQKFLYVNSNDESARRVRLTIKAKIELRVVWQPKILRLSLKEGSPDCPDIVLKSTDNQLFSISRFLSTGSGITADIDSSVQATQFVLKPKIDVEKLKTRPGGRITIGLVYPDPNTPPETANITFQALTRFSFKPPMLVALYGEAREAVKKDVWLINNYGEHFEVESAGSKEGRIKVVTQEKVGERYRFSVEITPPADDAKRFTDMFTIGLKDGEKLEVKCQGLYSNRSVKPRVGRQPPKTTPGGTGSSSVN
jgi:hypothetical protein